MMRLVLSILVLSSLLGTSAFAGVSVSIGIPGLSFETDLPTVRVKPPRPPRRVVFVDEDEDDEEEIVYLRRRYPLPCSNWNAFGSYAHGGGCNPFGCWAPGGSCNPFGCSQYGACSAVSCPSKVPSYACEK